MKISRIFIGLFISLLALGSFYQFGRSIWVPVYFDLSGRRTVEDVVKDFGPRAEMSLKPAFEKVGLSYPPEKVALLGFKEEKRLELWAKNQSEWIFVSEFKIKAASGKAGPKLKEGDRQVPEGIYRIESLNPNSSFHVSMKLNYPNNFDQSHAKADGRQDLGGDIFIHGKASSIGCLAMGDEVAEQLFVLIHRVGIRNVSVIIAPRDFRRFGIAAEENPSPPWLAELYAKIDMELKSYVVN